MKFKKSFKTMLVWRRNYRSLFRQWRAHLINRKVKRRARNYFSWKDRMEHDHQPYFYLARQQFTKK